MPVSNKYCGKNSTNCAYCLKKKFSLLNDLSEKELLLLNKNRIHTYFKKGDILFSEGENPVNLMCLNKGKVKISKVGSKKKEQIMFLKKPVDFIGFSELMADENFNTSGVAITDCSVCNINGADFFEVLRNNPDFFAKVTRFLSKEINHTVNRLVSVTQKNLRARLADSLLYLIEIYGFESDQSTINVSVKRSDIADIANMNTANVIRTLSVFKNENILSIKNRSIKVLDIKTLRIISES